MKSQGKRTLRLFQSTQQDLNGVLRPAGLVGLRKDCLKECCHALVFFTQMRELNWLFTTAKGLHGRDVAVTL